MDPTQIQQLNSVHKVHNFTILQITFKSPDILAPANIPVAAGKKMAKTEKKLCEVPSLTL